MRHSFVTLTLAVLTAIAAAPAAACPPLDACVVRLPSTTPRVAPAPQPAALTTRIEEPPARARAEGEIEMPWIWRALREQVYSRMPTYEEKHEFKIVFSPVVVTSLTDTIPGLGLSGDF